MSRKFFTYYIVLIFSVLFLFSCKKQIDKNCFFDAIAPVISVEGSKTALVNEEIDLTITYKCQNGNGHFGNLEETNLGNTTQISVIAKYEGCNQTDELPVLKTSYKFKKSQAGTYELKFSQVGGEFLTYTIFVK